ncbi:MAG: leucyl aminopeptidase [Phycisphaerales bacterium]|nr:leucyl aminopeptidase [Phycisphaerales bacterium]
MTLKDLGEVHAVAGADRKSPRLVVCLGAKEKLRNDTFRCAGGLLAKWLTKHDVARAAVDLAEGPVAQDESRVAAFLEGLHLGAFRFDRRKSSANNRTDVSVDWLVDGAGAREKRLLDRVLHVCEGVNLARDVAHEPPNVINPVSLAERAKSVARSCGLRCRVFDEKHLARMKAGALLAVGQGSDAPPRLIVLEHRGARSAPARDGSQGGQSTSATSVRGAAARGKSLARARGKDGGAEQPVLLIGKAVTFDTGGYSIKDRVGMVGMKYDKCGGMAVLGAMQAAARLNLPTPVVGVIAAAENMISGGAYRPNDIIRTMSGKTVEIISADAEGRLVLADALTYAQQAYKPRCMIDLATLTGGVSVALGSLRAGLMGNDDTLAADLCDCGERAHERLWRLPLDDEYFDLIAGDDSDFKNSADRAAHAIIGGIFLKQFVNKGVPWAHLDIAATGSSDKDTAYSPKGATGFGVRLLMEYLMSPGS